MVERTRPKPPERETLIARTQRIAKLIEKATRSKKAKPFSSIQHYTDFGIEGYESVSGRRRKTKTLIVSSWKETRMSHGIGSDDLASVSDERKFFEVRERGEQVFLAEAWTKHNPQGGPLPLMESSSSTMWFRLKDNQGTKAKPRNWERKLIDLTRPQRRTRAA